MRVMVQYDAKTCVASDRFIRSAQVGSGRRDEGGLRIAEGSEVTDCGGEVHRGKGNER